MTELDAAQSTADDVVVDSDREIAESQVEIDAIDSEAKKAEALAIAENATLSLMDEFKQFMTDNQCARMELDASASAGTTIEDLEAHRYLLYMAARRDCVNRIVPRIMLERLEKATHASDLEWCGQMPETTQLCFVYSNIVIQGGAINFIENTDVAIARQIKSVAGRGDVIDLNDDDIVNGFVKPEAVKRLIAARERHTNVIREFDAARSPYMLALEADASQARAFIEGGLQLPEFNDGVAAESDTGLQVRLNQSLEAAAIAISLYQREQMNLITRSDGQSNVIVAANLDDYYRAARQNGLDLIDIRTLGEWLNSQGLRLIMTSQDKHFSKLICMMPVFDCAVFLPRLATIFAQQQMVRVVEFSRIFRIYAAAIALVVANMPAPSETEKELERRRVEKQLNKLTKAGSGTEKSIRVNLNIPQHADTNPSESTIKNAFDKMRRIAIDDWSLGMDNLKIWYINETMYHSGEMSTAQTMLLDFKSRFMPKKVERDPYCIARAYYSAVWELIQYQCIGILHAYEANLMMRMQKYIHPGDREECMTEMQLPLKEQNNVLTTSLLLESNETLCMQRVTFWDSVKNRNEFAKLRRELDDAENHPPLYASTEIDDARVCEFQPWSPTIGQMKQYCGDVHRIFKLSSELQQSVFDKK